MQNLVPFQIGSLTIDPPLIQAPMAGVSHSPFRQLVADFAPPGLYFSEMLSARHLPNDIKKNSLWLQRSAAEQPLAYQIVASSPEEAASGASHLAAYGGEIIDLNLACPAPNIRSRRAGGHLLNDLSLVDDILAALRLAVPGPLSVKIRLGKKPDLNFLKELVSVLEQNRIDAVTLHPRLTTEKLRRRARWEYIGYLKEMTSIPVIGNGDVLNRDDCLKMFRQTGCDGVMVGRAAVQKPWIFAEICGTEIELNKEFLLTTYDRACQLITNYFKKEQALGRVKEFTWYFSKNLKFGHRFAARLQGCATLQACRDFAGANFLRAY